MIYKTDFINKVLREAFPNLCINKLDPIGSGYNCDAFLVNDKYVFKFPKSEKANESLITEAKVLHFLENKLPLAIPKIEFSSENCKMFPYRIVGYKQIKGRILTTQLYRSFTEDEKDSLAKSIAEFLCALHSIDIPDELKELEDDFVEGLRIDYDDIRGLIHDKLSPEAKEFTDNYYQNALSDSDYKAVRTALIHNDLSCNHIVIDEKENRVAGIIDFGDAAITDIDLEFVYLFEDSEEELGADFGKRVLKFYRHENEERLMKKIKLKQNGGAFEKILFGNAMGLDDMFNKGLSELQQKRAQEAVAFMPI